MTAPEDDNLGQRLLQAGEVFLKAKNDGKKVILVRHSNRLYHPLAPLSTVQDSFKDLTFLVRNDPTIATMILNQASRQILELQQKQVSPLLQVQLHRFIQNVVSHLYCGLCPSSQAKFESVLKKFCD